MMITSENKNSEEYFKPLTKPYFYVFNENWRSTVVLRVRLSTVPEGRGPVSLVEKYHSLVTRSPYGPEAPTGGDGVKCKGHHQPCLLMCRGLKDAVRNV